MSKKIGSFSKGPYIILEARGAILLSTLSLLKSIHPTEIFRSPMYCTYAHGPQVFPRATVSPETRYAVDVQLRCCEAEHSFGNRPWRGAFPPDGAVTVSYVSGVVPSNVTGCAMQVVRSSASVRDAALAAKSKRRATFQLQSIRDSLLARWVCPGTTRDLTITTHLLVRKSPPFYPTPPLCRARSHRARRRR